MGDINKPKGQPEPNEKAKSIAEVRKQLAELSSVIGGDKEVVAKEKQEVLDAAALTEQSDAELAENIRKYIEEAFKDPENAEQIKQTLEELREVLDEKAKLAAELNAENPELAEMEGNPVAKASMVTVVLSYVDTMFAGLADENPSDVAGKLKTGFMSGLRQAVVGFVEQMASVNIPFMTEPISFLGDEDIQYLEDYRFEEQTRLVNGNPELKAKYDENAEKYEREWRAAYLAWIVVGNGKPPTLEAIMNKPATEVVEGAGEAETEPGIFAEGQTERVIGSSEELSQTLEGDKRLRITRKEVVMQLADGSKKVGIVKASDNSPLEFNRILKNGVDTPAMYLVEAGSGAGSFTFKKLVDAVEKANKDGEKEIEVTDAIKATIA